MDTQSTKTAQAVINKRKRLALIPKIIIAVSIILILSGLFTGFLNHRQTGSWAGAGSNLTGIFILLIICGIVLLFLGIMLAYYWSKENQAVEEILTEEDVLAHWTYAPEMAQQFGAVEMARLKWQLYLVKLPLVTSGLGFFGWIGTNTYTIRMLLLSIGIGALVGLFLGLLSWLIAYIQATNTRKSATGDVYITKQGVLKGDTYHHWNTPNQRLTSVTYEATNPAVLQFNYLIGTSPILSSISTANLIANVATKGEVGYRTNLLAESVRVPVPPGSEQQAQKIAAMFSKLI